MDEAAVRRIARWYNARVKQNPSNPPTRRAVARVFDVSVSTAHRRLEQAEAGGMLTYPIRRRGAADQEGAR